MPRFFAPITVEELKEKVGKIDFLNLFGDWGSKMHEDLWTVFFVPQKLYSEEGIPALKGFLGYHQLENGFSFAGFAMSEDKETSSPVAFILYWDGKRVRGYVPRKGNVYNEQRGSAFGEHPKSDIRPYSVTNEDNADENVFPLQFFGKEYSVENALLEFDVSLLLGDIQERIQEKKVKVK